MSIKIEKWPFVLLGCLLLFGGALLGSVFGLPQPGVHLLGVFVGAVLLWLFVAIDWTSILVLIALCAVPGVGAKAVVEASFGNTTVWYLIFTFMLTYALNETGFLRRCALWFIGRPFARRSVWHFLFAYFAAMLAVGSFIAPTLAFLLFYALNEEICRALGLQKGSATARAMMVAAALMASISCAMTPFAHTFPLMALGYYEKDFGQAISHLDYLRVGLPSGLFLFAAAFLLLRLGLKRAVGAEGIDIRALKLERPAPMDGREAFSVAVFALVVLCWIAMGIFPAASPFLNRQGTIFAAMAGVVMLCAVRIGGKPALDAKQALARGISWPSILLCAAALGLGKFMTDDAFGITAQMSARLTPVLQGLPGVGLLLALIAATVVMTNFMSNIVTTTVMYNVAAPLLPMFAAAAGAFPPQLAAILVGLCASLAYATPPAIAHVAIAASSGWATPRDMLIYGGILALISILAVWAFSLLSLV